MSSRLTTTKAAALLARVQLNPEIGSADATYVAELVTRAANDLVTFCYLPRYPELAAGYTQSAASPSTDISALSTSKLWLSLNGQHPIEVNLTLAGLTTGAAIASHLQTQIQAIASRGFGFDEVTVTYASSLYTITSGRYGEDSSVRVSFNEDYKHVAKALKLTPIYGGIEVKGASERAEADDAVVAMVEVLYRKLGMEGAQSGSLPCGNSFSMFADELSGNARRILYSMRRLW